MKLLSSTSDCLVVSFYCIHKMKVQLCLCFIPSIFTHLYHCLKSRPMRTHIHY